MNFTLKHVVVAIILILGFAASATAGSLEDADAALKRRDYQTAVRLIRPLAEQGNAHAQYNSGFFRQRSRCPAGQGPRICVVHLVGGARQRGCRNFSRPYRATHDPAQIAEAQKLAREWNLRTPSR